MREAMQPQKFLEAIGSGSNCYLYRARCIFRNVHCELRKADEQKVWLKRKMSMIQKSKGNRRNWCE